MEPTPTASVLPGTTEVADLPTLENLAQVAGQLDQIDSRLADLNEVDHTSTKAESVPQN